MQPSLSQLREEQQRRPRWTVTEREEDEKEAGRRGLLKEELASRPAIVEAEAAENYSPNYSGGRREVAEVV
jgi:hypothetical protein